MSPQERQALERGLRSSEAFVLRRCQCLLKSAEGLTPRQIQRALGVGDQTVRSAIHAFHREGLACLEPKSHRPQSVRPLLRDEKLEAFRLTLAMYFGYFRLPAT